MGDGGATPASKMAGAADFSAPFVGVVEIVCGALVLIGLATRVACLPLMSG